MNVPFCIGRCGVCPYYESCQMINLHITEEE
jgi:hypothetical protein